MEDMPQIQFKVKEKWKNTKEQLDGFSMPLVGDLNGDGKPEVVGLGVRGNRAGTVAVTSLTAFGRYIIVYDGQTGDTVCKHNLNVSNDDFRLRSLTNRHNSPGHLALADLNGDGKGEIIVAETNSGKVYALTPTLDANKKIRGLTNFWSADTTSKYPVAAGSTDFNAGIPYVSDLNGDGVPEVIVYNKIYNGLNGTLECSLQTLHDFSFTDLQGDNSLEINRRNNIINNYAYVGRRPGADWEDDNVPCMAVIDIDSDGTLDIVAGSKVYLMTDDGTGRVKIKSIINGPSEITVQRGTNINSTEKRYVADGFTAVADIDLDGRLDVIVLAPAEISLDISTENLLYVWDPMDNPSSPKAAVYIYTVSLTGTMSFPFVGDINGRMDDFSGTKHLPEICFNGGVLQTRERRSSAIAPHPLSLGTDGFSTDSNGFINNGRFNKVSTPTCRGHIIGFTFHADPNGATPLHQRLKLSWAMEHGDESSCTGISMFDFDNDDIMELCYRDENSVMVISPQRKTYIPKGENVNAATGAIRFKKTGVISYTGFEAPVIADINGDGSADILTLVYTSGAVTSSHGYPYVFEADGESWAPARTVWNQAVYFPLQINANLTVPRHPQSTLTKYFSQLPDAAAGDSIQPFNCHWVQQPIVRINNYVPILMTPDPRIHGMKVISATAAETKLWICVENAGRVTANANIPVAFYHTGISPANKIGVKPLSRDVFVGARDTIEFTIAGDWRGMAICARLVDDGFVFPAAGYFDCDDSNNTACDIGQYPCTPTVTVAADGNTSICEEIALILTASYINDCVQGDDLTYRWEFRPNDQHAWQTLRERDTTVVCSSGTLMQNIYTVNSSNGNQTGYYRFRISARGNINQFVCRYSSDSLLVTINSLPPLNIPPVGDVCIDAPPLTLLPSPSDTTCSGSGVINGNQFSPSAADAGEHTVTYEYTDENGCTAVLSDNIRVIDAPKIPDIRVMVCPSAMRSINLTSFIDSLYYNVIQWERLTPHAPDFVQPPTGKIEGAFKQNDTYVYRYTVSPDGITCRPASAKLYMHTLRNTAFNKTDTIVVCQQQEICKSIQLNQVLGLDFAGQWEYDSNVNPDNSVCDCIKMFIPPSKYAGALVFDAFKAWTNTQNNSNYDANYHGDSNSKKFVFKYKSTADSCLNANKTIVIVVTNR
jgi:hypothetical protein